MIFLSHQSVKKNFSVVISPDISFSVQCTKYFFDYLKMYAECRKFNRIVHDIYRQCAVILTYGKNGVICTSVKTISRRNVGPMLAERGIASKKVFQHRIQLSVLNIENFRIIFHSFFTCTLLKGIVLNFRYF